MNSTAYGALHYVSQSVEVYETVVTDTMSCVLTDNV